MFKKAILLLAVIFCLVGCKQSVSTKSSIPTISEVRKNNLIVLMNDVEVSEDTTDNSLIFKKDGQPFSGVIFQQPEQDGPALVFYVEESKLTKQESFFRSGNLESSEEMQKGILDGKSLRYFEDGTLAAETYFVNGEPSGTWKFWNRSGNLVTEIPH